MLPTTRHEYDPVAMNDEQSQGLSPSAMSRVIPLPKRLARAKQQNCHENLPQAGRPRPYCLDFTLSVSLYTQGSLHYRC
jgi:hypothetical protein